MQYTLESMASAIPIQPAKKQPTPQVPALPGMTPLGFKPTAEKKKNPYRISATATLEAHGMDFTAGDLEALSDSIVPACCTEGCEVEPDGRCEHGCPSVMIALGVI